MNPLTHRIYSIDPAFGHANAMVGTSDGLGFATTFLTFIRMLGLALARTWARPELDATDWTHPLTESSGDITADWNDGGRCHRIRAGMARGRLGRGHGRPCRRIRPAAHLHAVGSDHG